MTTSNHIENLKKYSHQILIGVIVVLFITVLALAFGGGDDGAETTSKSSRSGLGLSVTWKEGEVLFSGNGKIWEFADDGTLLESDAIIRTGDDSKVILKTPNGSVVRLNENTELVVTQLTKKTVSLTQNMGRTYHRVKKGKEGTYELNAMDNTVKAVGTAFDVSVNATAKRINVKVLEGTVEVTSNSASEGRKIEKGKEVTVDPATSNLFSLADVNRTYVEGNWLQWNKEEDKEIGYSLSLVDEILAREEAKPTTTTTTTTATTTTTTAKTTTTSTPKSTYTSGSCKPSLTAKKDHKFGGVLLKWSTCSNEEFQFYKVVRSTLNSSPSYPNDPVILSSSNRSAASYIDKSVAFGRTYYYRACVSERLGKVSCGNIASVSY